MAQAPQPPPQDPHPGPAFDATATMANIAASLRMLRNRADLTLAELAAQAGIGKSTLAQIESGRANPSIETLFALASALSVPLARLLAAPTPEVTVVRAGTATRLDSGDDQFHALLLAASTRRGSYEMMDVRIDAGGVRLADAHSPGTIEHIMVIEGRMRVGPRTEPVELEEGDLATFDADVPHCYEALGGPARGIIVSHYPL